MLYKITTVAWGLAFVLGFLLFTYLLLFAHIPAMP